MVNKQLSFERLEKRVVLDAATFSIVGQSPSGWVTINNYAVVGGTLRGGSNAEEGWPLKALADFTRDGVTDVLIRQAGGEWELHVNDGGQLHAVPWFERPDTVGSSELVPPNVDPTATRASDDAIIVGAEDFDGDGQTDVALYDEVTGELWTAIARDTYVEEQLWATLQPVLAQDRIFVGDFSGDGASDVLVGVDGGRWTLARSTAEQDSLGASNWGAFPDYAWQYVIAGDFNGDSIEDVSAMAPDRTWWTWSGSPDGFGAAEYAGHWKMRDNWHDVGVEDFNGDGRDDIIGRSEEGELWVGTSTEEGMLHTWRWGTGWVHQANWSSITHVDFNEDGRIDQVGRAADGTWWLADNQGVNFRNEYITSTQGFTSVSEWLVVPAFARERSIDVSTFQALVPKAPLDPNLSGEGGEDSESDTGVTTNVTPNAKFVYRNDLATVTLDENNFVVLLAGEINLLGVEVSSRGGHLTPVSGSPDPFDFFLSNTESSVVFGNLNRLELVQNGRMTLPVKWDPAAGINDLIVQWGGRNSSDASGQRVQGRAFLDDELVALISPEDLLPVDASPDDTTAQEPSDVIEAANTELHVTVTDSLIELVNAPTDVSLIEVKSNSGSLNVSPDLLASDVIFFRHSDQHVLLLSANSFRATGNRIPLPLVWLSANGAEDLDVRIGSASLDAALEVNYQ